MTLDASAPWWDPNSPQDGHPLVRHAPEDGQYYTADGRQLERMRSGRMPIVVPRARRDGAPPGFDPHKASIVHVDPDAPDGGRVIDMTKVTRYAMDSAIQNARYPHQAYYQLGEPPQLRRSEPAPEPERTNPIMPGRYVAPKAAADGRQLPNQPVQEAPMQPMQPTTLPNNGHPAPAPAGIPTTPSVFEHQRQPAPPPYQPAPPPYVPPPQPAYYPPQPSYPQPAPPDLMAMLIQGQQQLGQMVAGLAQRMTQPSGPVAADELMQQGPAMQVQERPEYRHQQQRVQAQPPRSNGRSDNTFEDDATPIGHRPTRRPPARRQPQQEEELRQVPSETRRQRYSDFVNDQPADDDPIIAGFETLKIPYVNGPNPDKARCKVIFELPGRGKQRASYHGVIADKRCVVLTFDSLWEDGNPYLPPEPEETEEQTSEEQAIKLHVPHLKTTFTVYSAGLTFSHGCFDHIVLIIKDAEQLTYAKG